MVTAACPLCDCTALRPSWLKVNYDGHSFQFAECAGCQSLICDPMPSQATLRKMYDLSYREDDPEPRETGISKKFDEVIGVLDNLEPGTFIDYGCGEGKLLQRVRAMGWNVIGVDFNPGLSADVQSEGIKVFSIDDEIRRQADVVHLGDVLEHLTELKTQFPKILELVKPGGLLIAHGPLEANPNVFFRMIRFIKKLRGNPPTEMAPYHVILATSKGQLTLFKRAHLRAEDFRVTEIAFPAFEAWAFRDLRNLRATALFALRKISQLTGAKNTGNRFFYVGRKAEK